MSQPERHEILVLGSGAGGKLLAPSPAEPTGATGLHSRSMML